jgi:hypothetical protein
MSHEPTPKELVAKHLVEVNLRLSQRSRVLDAMEQDTNNVREEVLALYDCVATYTDWLENENGH